MFMVSREMGSWPLGVILTVRRAVFICGETEEMVPWTMVPEGGEGGGQLCAFCSLFNRDEKSSFWAFKHIGDEEGVSYHFSTQSSPSRWRTSSRT